MLTEDYVKQFVDQVVLIDLETGMQVTTRITGVANGLIECDDVMLFQIVTSVPNPSLPPGPSNPPEQNLQTQPVGGPFRDPNTSPPPIDLARVMFIHKPVDGIEKAYLQSVSGIEVVGAGAMHTLNKGGPQGIVR